VYPPHDHPSSLDAFTDKPVPPPSPVSSPEARAAGPWSRPSRICPGPSPVGRILVMYASVGSLFGMLPVKAPHKPFPGQHTHIIFKCLSIPSMLSFYNLFGSSFCPVSCQSR